MTAVGTTAPLPATSRAPTPDAAISADDVELVLSLQLVLGRLVRRLRRSSPGPAGVAGMSALASLAGSGSDADAGAGRRDAGGAPAGMRLSDLAAVENVSPPTMTRIIDHLAEQGLVRRVPNPADGRSSLVQLTGAGTDVLAAVRDERGRRLLSGIRFLDRASVDSLRAAVPALALLADEPRTGVGEPRS